MNSQMNVERIHGSSKFSVQKNVQASYRPNLGVCEKFTPAKFIELENLQNYDDLDDSQKILLIELETAGNHYEEGNYDAALAQLNWILEANKNNSEDLNPCALNILGAIYSNTGNYQKAIGYYAKIIPLSVKSKNRLWEATALTNIGLVYLELKKYAKAIQYFKIVIPIYTQLKDGFGLASTLNSYGAALRAMKLYKQAVATHSKALKIAKSIDSIEDKSLIGDIFEELGRDALAQNQIKKAIQIFKQSLVYLMR